MTLISVVLPTYNGSKYISRAIDSIINQTEKNWELIIVNDCSTDNTLEIINDYAQKDERIKIINNSQNMKLPASLNIGFRQAIGDYLTWTSDDNMYKPDAFSTMLEYLSSHSDIDFVSCDMDWVDEDLIKYAQHSNWADRTTPITLSFICNVGACFMYRHKTLDIIGEYSEQMFCAEDWDYWCRVSLKCNMAYLNKNCYTYVANKNGLSFTHRERADKMGESVVKKYAVKIINKYSNNIIEKVFAYSRLTNKYKTLIKLPITIHFLKILLFDIPIIIMQIFPNKQIRHDFRDYMNGVKAPKNGAAVESNSSTTYKQTRNKTSSIKK